MIVNVKVGVIDECCQHVLFFGVALSCCKAFQFSGRYDGKPDVIFPKHMFQQAGIFSNLG